MTAWGLKTYKKDKNESKYEDLDKNRRYVAGGVYTDEPILGSPPPVQFVLVLNGNLRAIVRRYENHLQSDTTRSIHSLWKSISGEENVETFLEHGLKSDYGKTFGSFDTLAYFGDFFLAGRALQDAFDIYCRLIYIRLNLMDQAVFLPGESLVGPIIKCARSAESVEQKKLAFELLENCLLYQSITGRLTDTMSRFLRQYYTSKDPSQECHIEPRIGNWSEDEKSKISDWILSTLKTTDMTISHAWTAEQPPELYLPIQHAIYAHFWRELLVDLPSLGPYVLAAQAPNIQQCEILATLSHILAQDMVDKHLGKLFGRNGASGDLSFAIEDFFFWLVNNESYTIDILTEIYQSTQAHGTSFLLHNLQTRLQNHSDIHTQCIQWLQEQALASVDTCRRLSDRANFPLSIEHEEEAKELTTALPDETEAMDVDITDSSHNGAPQSSTINEDPSAMTQSLYLCSSSIQSSMRSMLSMASRIKNNARRSTLVSLSQMSSNSMAMSISGSFGFGRVTGMGSASLPADGTDLMEIEEDITFEPGVVLVSSPYDMKRTYAALAGRYIP
jgi:hypothetical protein